MKSYRNVLCATDCSDFCIAAAERAAEMARFHGAQLTLLHVVEHFPVDRSNHIIAPENVDPKTYREQQARISLAKLAQHLKYDTAAQEVRFSTRAAKHTIVRVAKEQNADLIVVATHGRHGLTSILGSTAYGVTHTSPCDVMVVSAQRAIAA